MWAKARCASSPDAATIGLIDLRASPLLKTYAAVVDEEVVVSTPEGHSDFHALEQDLGAGRSDRFVFMRSICCTSIASICAAQRWSIASGCWRNYSRTRPSRSGTASTSTQTARQSTRTDVYAEDFAPAVAIDANRHDHGDRDDAAVLAHLHVGGIDPQVGVHVGLLHHRGEGLLGHAAWFEKPGK
jgi:hypothetical protein